MVKAGQGKTVVEKLLTLNTNHFRRVWQNGGNKIIMP
jgi:hypothetical protein